MYRDLRDHCSRFAVKALSEDKFRGEQEIELVEAQQVVVVSGNGGADKAAQEAPTVLCCELMGRQTCL
ncbi:TPA: hypothetical protein ACH3X1_011224 [Trebouxia sp. C0004]